MSADTADAPGVTFGALLGEQIARAAKVKFGDLLSERIEQANEVQRDTAEWLTDWMDHHDLHHELDEIERTVPRHLKDITLDAIAVIRDHLLTVPADGLDASGERYYKVGQAAISKWTRGRRRGGGNPSPEKWVAIAVYMGLPLGEFYRLLKFGEYPRSIPALQQRLYGVERSLRSERKDNQRLREENLRANRTLAANAERLATLERELQEVADEATRRVSS